MSEADTEVDPVKRAALVHEANAIIADQVPLLPLFQSPDVVAWRSRLQGLKLKPSANHTWNMEAWWVSE
jgi:peptide/nickel transport system substrate-binding protein